MHVLCCRSIGLSWFHFPASLVLFLLPAFVRYGQDPDELPSGAVPQRAVLGAHMRNEPEAPGAPGKPLAGAHRRVRRSGREANKGGGQGLQVRKSHTRGKYTKKFCLSFKVQPQDQVCPSLAVPR